MADNLLNKEELIKSLKDLDFSEEEIFSIIKKGEDEGKFEEEKTIDKEAEEKENMKKAYDEVMSAKTSLEKAMENFLNKYGNVPGFEMPNDFVKKSEDVDIEKSMVDSFEKSFGDKFDNIIKGLESQLEFNNNIQKSLEEVQDIVKAIAEAPNPLKSLIGQYGFIEKGIKEDADGKKIYSLKNKEQVNEQFAKSIDKIEDEQDKQTVRDLISTFNISGFTSQKGLDIVKKALNIDFEK